MEEYIEMLSRHPLFKGIRPEQLAEFLHCLHAERHDYKRGEWIYITGDTVQKLGVIMSGRINTVHEDVFGSRSIIGVMEPGELFGDAFSCASDPHAPVSIVAQEDSAVLMIQVQNLLHICPVANIAEFAVMSENLIRILADKYVLLNRKIIHLSARSTRRKILSYLSEQDRIFHGPFPVHFTQQELADYLFVERTGLSTEWNRLKKQQVLTKEGKLYRFHLEHCKEDIDE